ncbi:DUF4240 domain-containing protein [Intrasporangium mesophilum]
MGCIVQLNKASWLGQPQRLVVPRTVEQTIQQRAAAVRQFADNDAEWSRWTSSAKAWLSIQATFFDRPRPTVLHPESLAWSLEVSLDARDYEALAPGVEVGLRFIQTLEQVLVEIAGKVQTPPPTHLGRSRRELEWLAQGPVEPGPGSFGEVRVRKPAGPMPEGRFWSLIDSTLDERSGVFRLGWQQADRFTARMRLMIQTLDTPAHRASADSVLGFVSDDVWEDVRAWVVSGGKDAYLRVVADPGELATMLQSLDSQDDLSRGEQLLFLEGRD